ncbi:MAG: BMC domain-containing protein [Candidatus Eisenbacteria bacterium]|nr:BMC domain-containing protein [Candidatus Eisenbacteria bacterium]
MTGDGDRRGKAGPESGPELAGRVSASAALGLVELNSVAIGVQAADEMLKVAPVELVEATPVCAGKYVVIVKGDVASVDASVARGEAIGAESVVDTLFLPNPHPGIFPALTGTSEVQRLDSLGVIETFSVASTIMSADLAGKAARVKIIEIRLAKGLGGKAFVTMTGAVSEVEASVSAGSAYASKKGLLVRSVVIPRPDESLFQKVL